MMTILLVLLPLQCVGEEEAGRTSDGHAPATTALERPPPAPGGPAPSPQQPRSGEEDSSRSED